MMERIQERKKPVRADQQLFFWDRWNGERMAMVGTYRIMSDYVWMYLSRGNEHSRKYSTGDTFTVSVKNYSGDFFITTNKRNDRGEKVSGYMALGELRTLISRSAEKI